MTKIDKPPRLGVNLDHIATLRQLRGTPYPDLLEAARITTEAGAEQITVHLREDRRHIQDADVIALRRMLKIPLNLEMAVTDEMVRFAKKHRPDWVCLVPEKRQELTTEGGLDVLKAKKKIAAAIHVLHRAKVKVSLFIEPSPKATLLSAELGADAVEFHTGRYCTLTQALRPNKKLIDAQVKRLVIEGTRARALGMGSHAGHGFDYQNVRPIAALTHLDGVAVFTEYNIGHAIVCRAAMVGLGRAVREMVSAISAP